MVFCSINCDCTNYGISVQVWMESMSMRWNLLLFSTQQRLVFTVLIANWDTKVFFVCIDG